MSGDKNGRFLANERAIFQEVDRKIEARSMTLKMSDLCRQTHLSRTTIYNHYRNPDEARRAREERLRDQFLESIPETPSRVVIFTMLLAAILRERAYFRAAMKNHDFHVLTEIFEQLQVKLTGTKYVHKPTYICYLGELEAIIQVWAVIEHFPRKRIPEYARKLASVRMVRMEV